VPAARFAHTFQSGFYAKTISSDGVELAQDDLQQRHLKHRPHDFDSDTFCDPASWNKASYSPDLLDEIEPLPDAPNGYRQAALAFLHVMATIDGFILAAPIPELR
jgi:hypothetical protein